MRVLRDAHDEMRPIIAEVVARRARLAEMMDQRYDPDYRAKWNRLLDDEEQFVKNVVGGA
jgi:hypothetical protein